MLEGLRASLPATGIADVMWFTTNKEEQNNKNEEALFNADWSLIEKRKERDARFSDEMRRIVKIVF